MQLSSKWLSRTVTLLLLLSSSLSAAQVITGSAGSRLQVDSFGRFDQPWAMTFLPDGHLLITEKPGRLLLVNPATQTHTAVGGLPAVAYGGQGGLGDIILHPEFASNRLVYLSYAEAAPGSARKRGAVVARARLDTTGDRPELKQLQVIWRQQPKVTGSGHYSHRLAFSPDGKLFITSGDRQKLQPAQDIRQSLGKIIRLNDDGSLPADNPFQLQGELAKSFWTLGHRNLLGIAFDAYGRLWSHEMGPRHGDELNLITPAANYGWPEVSWGDHYSGLPIPDHDTRPEFMAPALYWVPTVAPSGLVICQGERFEGWQDQALIGGLRSEALLRIRLPDITTEAGVAGRAEELERFAMGNRIREVEQGPDGAIWLLEDGQQARLLRLTQPR